MEMLTLMLSHKNKIMIFKRCVDAMFVIWKKQGDHDNEFEEFKKTLNAISNLNSECYELSEKVNF